MNKSFAILLFSIKYELKRSIIPLAIIMLIFFGSKIPFVPKIGNDLTSISIVDLDNTSFSREFVEFLKEEGNITVKEEAIKKIVIPNGFEKDYLNYSATIKESFLVNKEDEYYKFQLDKLGDKNRITTEIDLLGAESFGQGIMGIIVAFMFASSFASYFKNSRKDGNLHFIVNHFNFWGWFVLNNLVMIGVIFLGSIKQWFSIEMVVLFLFLFLSQVLVVFWLRKQVKLLDYLGYVYTGVGVVIVYLKTIGFENFPIVNLIVPGFQPFMIVDIILTLFFFYSVSKIKVTE